MKIADVQLRVEDIPLTRPYTIAFRHIDRVRIPVLILRDDAGRTGLGAASPERYVTGETIETCVAALDPAQLAWLRGAEPGRIPALEREAQRRMPHTPAARAAVDMALWDLFAQSLGRPLVDVFGRAHDVLPTSVTIGIMDTAEAIAQADLHLAEGFRVLKIKLGRDLDADLERITRLRQHVGDGVTLRVDPNQGYDIVQLRTFLDATRGLGLELVEQPIPVPSTELLRQLPEAERRRVALDEALLGEAEALRFAQPPWPGGIHNIKLMKCGGITAARRLAAIAEAAGLSLMWGCNDESRISISAALHAAFASPATRYLDLDGSFDLARDVALGGFVLENGQMRTTDAPGLGLTLLHG